jgi:DNA polymerase-4
VRARTLEELQRHFGRYGQRLYELARGVDENPVVPNRPTQSISAEDTFEQDVLLSEMEPMIRRMAEKVWAASRKEPRSARTVVLKLKTADFQIRTRSVTPTVFPASAEELASVALSLVERAPQAPGQKFRLVGVGLGNFSEPEAKAEGLLFQE